MPNFRDLTGMKFGRYTVVEFAGRKNRAIHWKCLCDCGETKIVATGHLTAGRTVSCGCYSRERAAKGNTTHGKSRSRVYKIWLGMLQRCQNPNSSSYDRYGGRGIKVCKRWESFENFYEDMGDPPRRTSLDRIDNDGDYEPGNCKWATRKEQASNTRRNHIIEYQGEEFILTQLAEKVGINHDTLRSRLRNGWSVERAVETPVRQS